MLEGDRMELQHFFQSPDSSMATLSFLHRFFENNCAFMHGARRKALLTVSTSLLNGARLNLSSLGRHLSGVAHTKHRIKRVDRLLANRHLQRERAQVYEAMARWALRTMRRPVVLVDWSPVESHYRYQVLKVAVAVNGRALTLYDEVHPVKGCSRRRAERRVLKRFAAMVPAGCCPIIVTDAGFHSGWFRAVRRLGWDFVGRVRGTVHIRFRGEGFWYWDYAKALHAKAGTCAQSFAQAQLSREHREPVRVCLSKAWRTNTRRRRGARPASPGRREPWVLVTSLDETDVPAAQVVNVYAARMQIEETFRDFKAPRWGFGLGFARSRSTARSNILLLLAALAHFALWLMGLAARALDWHRHFQANTVTGRHVLSVISLGREVHRHPRFHLPDSVIEASAELLRLQAHDLKAYR